MAIKIELIKGDKLTEGKKNIIREWIKINNIKVSTIV